VELPARFSPTPLSPECAQMHLSAQVCGAGEGEGGGAGRARAVRAVGELLGGGGRRRLRPPHVAQEAGGGGGCARSRLPGGGGWLWRHHPFSRPHLRGRREGVGPDQGRRLVGGAQTVVVSQHINHLTRDGQGQDAGQGLGARSRGLHRWGILLGKEEGLQEHSI
jgi:hypothetical protein